MKRTWRKNNLQWNLLSLKFPIWSRHVLQAACQVIYFSGYNSIIRMFKGVIFSLAKIKHQNQFFFWFLAQDLMDRLTAAEDSIASLNTAMGLSHDTVFGVLCRAANQIGTQIMQFMSSCFENLGKMILWKNFMQLNINKFGMVLYWRILRYNRSID